MKYISSDTNIWIDFVTINCLELPFKLPYIYLMDQDAIEDEIRKPPGLSEKLIQLGLQKTQLSEEEFFLAEELVERYVKPSRYDCIALAIAKARGITLLTGDGPLRRAAALEGVNVIGTIGILDQLLDGQYVDPVTYKNCISSLLEHNRGKIRLPENELRKRLDWSPGKRPTLIDQPKVSK